MQGTVSRFDDDGSGEAVLDSGRRVPFDAAAVAASGLDTAVRCGLSNVALNVIEFARSAVSRTTIT
jgi:hypothetical protein